MKRNIFIILSGIITAAGVLGWSRQAGMGIYEQDIVPVISGAQIQPDKPSNLHETLIQAMQNDFDRQFHLLELGAKSPALNRLNGDANIIRLLTPSVAPEMDKVASKPDVSGVLSEISAEMNGLKVDIADMPASPEDAERTDFSGNALTIAEDSVSIVSIICPEGMPFCLTAKGSLKPSLTQDQLCDASKHARLVCKSGNTALFSEEGCREDALDKALDKAVSADKDQGTIAVGGERFAFRRSSVLGTQKINALYGESCRLYTVQHIAAAESEISLGSVSEDTKQTSQPPFLPQGIWLALLCGAAMIALGSVLTKPRQDELRAYAPEKSPSAPDESKESTSVSENSEESTASAEPSASGKSEAIDADAVEKIKAEYEASMAKLQAENDELQRSSAENIKKLEEIKADMADIQAELKYERLRSQSLENDKKTLNEMVNTENTAVDSIRHWAESADTHSAVPVLTREDMKPESIQEISLSPENIEHEEANQKPTSVLDAMTDDGWDEIAESFDRILVPSSEGNKKVDSRNPSADEILSSVTGLIEELGLDDRRSSSENNPKRHNTEVGIHPVSDIKSDIKPLIPGNPSGDSSRPQVSSSSTLNRVGSGQTISGIGASRPEALSKEHQAVESAPELAIGGGDKEDSFKPAPSWTGKSVVKKSVDENSLFAALKRRARDVSEVGMTAVSDAAGDASAMRSKSGFFSMTGSRVDINPLSDNEYFKSLYESYIQTQKECGERTDKFTLEQFVSRLAREKENLMKSYHCKNVRFQVYVKNGKASLKAMPQKN